MTANRRRFLLSCLAAPFAALTAMRARPIVYGVDLSHGRDLTAVCHGQRVVIDEWHSHKNRALCDALEKASKDFCAFETTGRQAQIVMYRMSKLFA